MDGASGATDRIDLTHREKRVLFSVLLSTIVLWANERPGWELALDEGMVHSPRKMRTEGGTYYAQLADAVHKPGSYHYLGMAADLNLYVRGLYVRDGESPEWKSIAEKWEALHPACVAGVRWQDGNHLAVYEGLHLKETEPLPWLRNVAT